MNAITFQWIQNHRSANIEENLPLQIQLKVAKVTIDGLRDRVANYDNGILRLEAKVTLVEACIGVAEI